jgi:hypothetical protein
MTRTQQLALGWLSLAACTGSEAAGGADASTACVDIRSHGGAGDGMTDNAAALTAAYAALPTTGGCIEFPGGKFVFRSGVTFDFPSGAASITLQGAGPDATILHWPQSDSGLVFNYSDPQSSTHVRDLTLTTGLTGGGVALTLQTNHSQSAQGSQALIAQNDVSNVTIRGDDGGGVNEYWGTGIVVSGVSFIDVNGLAVYGDGRTGGTGLSLSGLAPADASKQPLFGLYYNITASYFIGLGLGLHYGTYIQGVTINTTNFQNGMGPAIKSDDGEQGLGNLTIESCQFNVGGSALIQGLSGFQVQMTNSIMFLLTNQVGIDLSRAGATFTQITGSSFAGSGATNTTAIVIGPGSVGAVISGNAFVSDTLAVHLMAGSANANVESNFYLNTTTHVLDDGSNDKVGGGSD